MHKLLLVARSEYLRRARTRSFLFATGGMPLMLIAAMGAVVFIMIAALKPSIGVADLAGMTDLGQLEEEGGFLQMNTDFTPYDPFSGKVALETGDIDALVVLPEGYPSLAPIQILTADGTLDDNTRSEIEGFLRTQLAQTLPEPEQSRLLDGWDITIHSFDGERSFTRSQTLTTIIMPYVIGFFFFLSVIMSSGYMLQAVTEEKENRTMEIMMTSMRPLDLIAGKSLGLLSLSLTQLLVWLGTAAGVLGILNAAGIVPSVISVDMGYLGILALYFLPSFILAAGIMIAIGSSVTEMQQGQQIAGIVNLLFIAPWLTSGLAFANPESPLLLGMTLFPTTSMLTVALRWSSSVIPAWQILLSLFILIFSALASIWVSSRVFHAGMLRYGKRLSLQAVLSSLRSSPESLEVAP